MYRGRRLRATAAIRDLVRENSVQVTELIYPVFVSMACGTGGAEAATPSPIESMPGISAWPLAMLAEEVERVYAAGIRSVLLFGISAKKDACGEAAADPQGPVPAAIRLIKAAHPDMVVIADVCLCEYTTHGHCGLIGEHGEVLNDATLPHLAAAARCYAEAGADIVAPSDMMDGRVAAIRAVLDRTGHENVAILSYAAKFASGYYGPFRDAAHSAPSFGDRRTYQMDPANGREALREVAADLAEGADMVIAKPAIAYLDVLRDITTHFNVPVIAYNVSGEYAMVKAAAANGWIDERRVVMENMIGMKRAGATAIITYHAPDVARWLQQEL